MPEQFPENPSCYVGQRRAQQDVRHRPHPGRQPQVTLLPFYKEGFFGRIGKTLGMQDVEVGDVRFDQMFVVKCSDPDFFKGVMLENIKEQFYEVWETHKAEGIIGLQGRAASYDEPGRIANERIRDRIGAVCDLLCALRNVVLYYNR